jgi:nucleoside-diphosphate-sugar epimerase
MKRICIIGGTGHIGKNLTEMLVDEGFEVFVLARGEKPIPSKPQWERVKFVRKFYHENLKDWEEVFQSIQPEVVIDILGSYAPAVYGGALPYIEQFILCGSVWMFGEPKVVPTPEETQSPCIFPGYAKRYSEMLELKERAKSDGIKFTAIMPPNICGPGKILLDCYGGRSLERHLAHKRGEPVPLPEPGNTLIGPCDAEDVARGFYLAVMNPDDSADEIFNVGSAYALTAKEFVETYGRIYGVKIPIEWHSWREYSEEINPDLGANFHFKAHMCPSIKKISEKLGYKPRYAPEETMERAVNWMRENGMI